MNWLQQIWEKIGQQWFLLNSEVVKVKGPKGEMELGAKIDTGAEQSSIDESIAKQLGLLDPSQVVGKRWVKSGLGRQERLIVACEIMIRGQWQKTKITYTDRSHLSYPVLIGRADMREFLVKPVFPKSNDQT